MRRMRSLILCTLIINAAMFIYAAEPGICKTFSAGDLEQIQGAKLRLVKPPEHDGKLTVASCYFRMDPDAKSVSLEIISRSKGDAMDPREFWRSRFDKSREEDEGEAESTERRRPPEKIDNLGDEAYWFDTGRDGALYVLRGGKIIRLSLGGATPRDRKKKQAEQLARVIVTRS